MKFHLKCMCDWFAGVGWVRRGGKGGLILAHLQCFSHISLFYGSFQPLLPEAHSNMETIFITFSLKEKLSVLNWNKLCSYIWCVLSTFFFFFLKDYLFFISQIYNVHFFKKKSLVKDNYWISLLCIKQSVLHEECVIV